MVIKFNTGGNEKQKECARAWLDPTIKDIVYGGAKYSGKSFLGCSLILGDALMYPGTFYFIARKKLSDLRKYTIPSIHEVLGIYGIHEKYFKYNGTDNFFEFHNGSKIFLLDAKYLPSDPTYARFGSMQMTRGWIEEAGEMEDDCKKNLQISIGRWNNLKYNLVGKLLNTCNPAKNYLYSEFYMKDKLGTIEPEKKFIQALPSDNKRGDPAYYAELERTLDNNGKQRLLYGNWEYDDNPYSMFDYNDILGVFTNEFVKPTEERYMTCDIAYTGSDKFVIILWAGMVAKKIIAIDKIDDTMVSKKIHDLRMEYNIPLKNVIYDADGLQTFTRHSSKEGNLKGARPFNNGGTPVKVSGKVESFKNLKAQCYHRLSEIVKSNEIFIEDQVYRKQIIEELEQINRLPLLDDGKFALEKKDDLRKRLGRSPDFADAIMMRAWFEIKGIQKARIVW